MQRLDIVCQARDLYQVMTLTPSVLLCMMCFCLCFSASWGVMVYAWFICLFVCLFMRRVIQCTSARESGDRHAYEEWLKFERERARRAALKMGIFGSTGAGADECAVPNRVLMVSSARMEAEEQRARALSWTQHAYHSPPHVMEHQYHGGRTTAAAHSNNASNQSAYAVTVDPDGNPIVTRTLVGAADLKQVAQANQSKKHTGAARPSYYANDPIPDPLAVAVDHAAIAAEREARRKRRARALDEADSSDDDDYASPIPGPYTLSPPTFISAEAAQMLALQHRMNMPDDVRMVMEQRGAGANFHANDHIHTTYMPERTQRHVHASAQPASSTEPSSRVDADHDNDDNEQEPGTSKNPQYRSVDSHERGVGEGVISPSDTFKYLDPKFVRESLQFSQEEMDVLRGEEEKSGARKNRERNNRQDTRPFPLSARAQPSAQDFPPHLQTSMPTMPMPSTRRNALPPINLTGRAAFMPNRSHQQYYPQASSTRHMHDQPQPSARQYPQHVQPAPSSTTFAEDRARLRMQSTHPAFQHQQHQHHHQSHARRLSIEVPTSAGDPLARTIATPIPYRPYSRHEYDDRRYEYDGINASDEMDGPVSSRRTAATPRTPRVIHGPQNVSILRRTPMHSPHVHAHGYEY